MIPFFRKIRKKLADDNKPIKYLRYAIGEIVLVVIGILIALQINNWNEERKASERMHNLFERTQKELLYNIKRCNISIDFYRGKDSLLFKVVNNKVTYDDYKEFGDFSSLITVFQSADLVNEAFNNLIENNTPLSQKQDSIVLKLKELYGTEKKGVDEMDLKTASLVNNFLDKLKNEKEWYSEWNSKNRTITDVDIDYFLTDPFYMNEVSHFELYALRNHLPKLLEFKHKAMKIYNDISDYLELKKDSLVAKNINDYEHYIGAYKLDSINDLNIVRKKNNLKGNIVAKNDTIIINSFHIYLDSKDYFIVDDNLFGKLIYDENGDVTKMIMSNGSFRTELRKMTN